MTPLVRRCSSYPPHPSRRATRILCVLLACFGLTGIGLGGDRSVSTAEATGTWRNGSSEITILPLGGGRLRVELNLIFEYRSGGELTANEGAAGDEATIEGDVAVFEPEDTDGCKITMTFLRNGKLEVEQEGDSADCGFGHRVRADGTYRKVSSKKRKFGQ